jgi:hypothetical protein
VQHLPHPLKIKYCVKPVPLELEADGGDAFGVYITPLFYCFKGFFFVHYWHIIVGIITAAGGGPPPHMFSFSSD